MSRLRLLEIGIAILLAGAFWYFGPLQTQDEGSAAWPRDGRPNVVLIITDDQRWDQLGLVQRELGSEARFPFLETPHLDALAQQGMRFRNGFVTTSICSPSRSSMLTGQYVHTHGVMDNLTPFSPRPTWATALQGAGYTTAYFGKWHHSMQKERPGFDYVATFAGQGRYFGTSFLVEGEWIDTEADDYVDSQSVDFLIDYLRNPSDKPFALVLGLKGVHEPFEPKLEHKGSYGDSKLQVARNWSALPPWVDASNSGRRAPVPRKFWSSILETVRGVDTSVGRVMAALDELELADNTLVIFTSDNGYYLGEHTLGDKRSAYEESIRVPMLARLPGVIPAGSVSEAMVLNIDIAPTILELAGAEVPGAMQGSSMQTLFSAQPEAWRDAFLYEYWQIPHDRERWPDNKPSIRGALNVLKTPTMLAIRTQEHKLVTYRGEPGYTELFDLRADPYEKNNLAHDEAHAALLADLCDRLETLAQQYNYSYSLPIQKWFLDSTFIDKAGSIYAGALEAPVEGFSGCQQGEGRGMIDMVF